MKVLLLALVLVVVAIAPPAAGHERLKIAVSPARSFAPSLVRVRVRVEPNPENRMLRIVADSDEFYRRSDLQLDGDNARPTVEMELRNLPGGEYEFTGVLIDSTGKESAIARAQATVLSPMNDPPPGNVPW